MSQTTILVIGAVIFTMVSTVAFWYGLAAFGSWGERDAPVADAVDSTLT